MIMSRSKSRRTRTWELAVVANPHDQADGGMVGRGQAHGHSVAKLGELALCYAIAFAKVKPYSYSVRSGVSWQVQCFLASPVPRFSVVGPK